MHLHLLIMHSVIACTKMQNKGALINKAKYGERERELLHSDPDLNLWISTPYLKLQMTIAQSANASRNYVLILVPIAREYTS